MEMKKWVVVMIAGLVMGTEAMVRLAKTQPGPTAAEEIPVVTPTAKPTPMPTPVEWETIVQDVPFAAQAPFGEWSDPRQQDGCEETSVLMAMKWVKGETVTPAEAKAEVIKMADYEVAVYGTFVDTSAHDTNERLLKNYFGYDQGRVISVGDSKVLVTELMAGNILIVPADGQLLGNPNFTRPGPERHMLVVKGYDARTQEFITNDPGTRAGEDYRYAEKIFWNAMRDYPTGDHLPITKVEKRMIVVSKG